MDNSLQLLGERIKKERKKRGFSQERLAELSGVSNNFISYIESGRKNASFKTIKKIADALEISLSNLFQAIPQRKKYRKDTTSEQLLSLVRDENPTVRKSLLNICKTIIREKNKKYG